MSFAHYDPVFRTLTSFASSVDPTAYRAMLETQGEPFIELDDLTAPFDAVYVTEDLQLAFREEMPSPLRHQDVTTDQPFTVPPLSVAAPEGTVCEPPPGTVLESGQTRVLIRAPGFLDHYYDVTVWTAEHEKARLIAYAANRRWELEQGGAIWNGHRVDTDDRAKIMIMGSVLAAQMNPGWETVWQFMDGSSALVGAAEVVQLSGAIQARVSGLFSTFEAVRLRIVEGSLTTDAEVHEAFE